MLFQLIKFIAGSLAFVFLCLAQLSAQDKPLVVSGCEYNYPPCCYLYADGQATGFSVELMRAALKSMNRQVRFETGEWDELKNRLEVGDLDALPLVGRTLEREEIFDFTFPYIEMRGAFVVRQGDTPIKSTKELSGRTVAVMKSDNAEEYLTRGFVDFEIITTSTFSEALSRLSAGEFDAVLIQRLVGLRLIQTMNINNLVVGSPIKDFKQAFCFAVKSGDKGLLSILNEGLAIVVADGTWSHLHAKWFGTHELPTNRKLRIGLDYNLPPFEYVDENGSPSGLSTEVTHAIASATGLVVELYADKWSAVLQALDNREIDAVQNISYTVERNRKYLLSQPHTTVNYVVVTRKGEQLSFRQIEDLKGRKILVQDGDVLHERAIELEMTENLIPVVSQEDALKLLADGQYDCAFVARFLAMKTIEEEGWTNLYINEPVIFTAEFCYATLPENRGLLALLNEGVKMIETTQALRKIHAKWLGVDYYENIERFRNVAKAFGAGFVLLLVLFGLFWVWSQSLKRQVQAQTEELRRSEALLTLAQELGGIGSWEWDLTTNTLHSTAELAAIHGLECFSSNKSIEDKLNLSYECYLPAYRAQIRQAIDDCISQAKPYSLDCEFQAHTGERKWVTSAGSPVLKDGQVVKVVGYLQDITRKKAHEIELDRLRTAIEQAGDMIVVVDKEGIIQYVNPAFERVTGYSISEAVGNSPKMLRSDKQSPEFYIEMWKTISSGQIWNGRMINRKKDGSEFVEELSIAPVVDKNGEVLSYIAVKRDVTEEDRMQQQLVHSQKMETVGLLAGGVAHDYNNMLNVILGYADLLLESPKDQLTDDSRNCLEEIRKAAKRSADITRQLLTFARKQPVNPRIIEINESVAAMAGMLRRLIRQDIEIQWIPGTDPSWVKIDPVQVDQLLANLCLNARDAIEASGKITISTSKVSIREEDCTQTNGLRPGDFLLLAISDTGSGISEEDQMHLFEPFFTTKSMGRGTGLGLASVYGIVKQNDGFINVYSEMGQGTTFKVYLPLSSVAGAANNSEVSASACKGKGETILIVEDDQAILSLCKRILRDSGYGVVGAENSVEAMEKASDSSQKIDLLLTDIVLPDTNGIKLSGELKSLRPELKCLYMSGYMPDFFEGKYDIENEIRLLNKPFTRKDLLKAIGEALKDQTDQDK